MTMPNFLIIGAAKSGTTSLHYYLRQHPQIYMCPRKDPAFFVFEGEKVDLQGPWRRWASRNFITDLEAYQVLFQGVSDEVAIGEVSTAYLPSPRAAERIKHYVPDMKLIAIIRDPVERLYSDFLMVRRYGGLPVTDLAQVIHRKEAFFGKDGQLLQVFGGVGFYYTHLKRYFDTFDQSQIRVYLYEDLDTDSVGLLQDIFRFLEVDVGFTPDLSIRYNVGGVARNKVWHAFLTRLNPITPLLKQFIPHGLRRYAASYFRNLQGRILVEPPSLAPEVRRELIQVYREDILKLQVLLQRDLSRWLE